MVASSLQVSVLWRQGSWFYVSGTRSGKPGIDTLMLIFNFGSIVMRVKGSSIAYLQQCCNYTSFFPDATFPAQGTLDEDFLVYWIGEMYWACAACLIERVFLRERKKSTMLGQYFTFLSKQLINLINTHIKYTLSVPAFGTKAVEYDRLRWCFAFTTSQWANGAKMTSYRRHFYVMLSGLFVGDKLTCLAICNPIFKSTAEFGNMFICIYLYSDILYEFKVNGYTFRKNNSVNFILPPLFNKGMNFIFLGFIEVKTTLGRVQSE